MLTATMLLLAFLQLDAERASILAIPSEPPQRNFGIIYYDDSFLFAGRHYGSSASVATPNPVCSFIRKKDPAGYESPRFLQPAGDLERRDRMTRST